MVIAVLIAIAIDIEQIALISDYQGMDAPLLVITIGGT
jgi:hypothetical protein